MLAARSRALAHAALDEPLSDEEALDFAEAGSDALPAILEAAGAARDRAFGRRVTFSPKVFLPLTNLCRNHCDYCSYRRSPGDAGEWTMRPEEVARFVAAGRREGCVEALFCLGDKPETAFPAYRRTLAAFGQASTTSYLHHGAEVALAQGLLPHTNAGLLTDGEMARLKEVNVSLGLMLENVSPRLGEKGMPHHRAPDKRPEKRLAMIEGAGRLRIPFTTGILVGIGETRRERVESLLAIRRLSRAHGHIQEVIVQNFRAVAGVPMQHTPEPDAFELSHAVAMARLILDGEVGVQAPPNLSPGGTASLLAAGINDFGGISPVTPDYINPRHPWPHLTVLATECAEAGFTLRPRLPIYDRYIDRDGFLDPGLREVTRAAAARLAGVEDLSRLAAPPQPAARPAVEREERVQ
ncbi:MAG: 7,8-didemethyl-8-hydroxy-5-deazariboflavin synthase subunit CofG [Myxococcales bacterium]|nr:7,8-didemethyl-8-hydroxy-5-deazariboflavin synthase subunit CofG [Myxococcales bacterium]